MSHPANKFDETFWYLQLLQLCLGTPADKRSQPLPFIEELKRRNVFRVAVGYIITAWLLLQAVDLVLENINAPDWVIQVFMLALAVQPKETASMMIPNAGRMSFPFLLFSIGFDRVSQRFPIGLVQSDPSVQHFDRVRGACTSASHSAGSFSTALATTAAAPAARARLRAGAGPRPR